MFKSFFFEISPISLLLWWFLDKTFSVRYQGIYCFNPLGSAITELRAAKITFLGEDAGNISIEKYACPRNGSSCCKVFAGCFGISAWSISYRYWRQPEEKFFINLIQLSQERALFYLPANLNNIALCQVFASLFNCESH